MTVETLTPSKTATAPQQRRSRPPEDPQVRSVCAAGVPEAGDHYRVRPPVAEPTWPRVLPGL